MAQWQQLIGTTGHPAGSSSQRLATQTAYMDIIHSWKGYGSNLIEVKLAQKTRNGWPEKLWLAISHDGIGIYPRYERECLAYYRYESVLGFGADPGRPNQYRIVVDTVGSMLFETNMVLEIATLMKACTAEMARRNGGTFPCPGFSGFARFEGGGGSFDDGRPIVRAPQPRARVAALNGDIIDVELDVATGWDVFPSAEVVAAVAAKLGMPREDIYIVDGKALLYRPTITVSIIVLGNEADAPQVEIPVVVALVIECGPTDNSDTTAPTTARYALRKIAETAFGIAEAEAEAEVWLHVGDSAGGARQKPQGFRKLEGEELDCSLAAAGIADGAVLGVSARKKGWRRRKAKLVPVRGSSSSGAPCPDMTTRTIGIGPAMLLLRDYHRGW